MGFCQGIHPHLFPSKKGLSARFCFAKPLSRSGRGGLGAGAHEIFLCFAKNFGLLCFWQNNSPAPLAENPIGAGLPAQMWFSAPFLNVAFFCGQCRASPSISTFIIVGFRQRNAHCSASWFFAAKNRLKIWAEL